MKATFKIGEVGEYMPTLVQENDFLNEKLENDMYGIYYSVRFEGDADTYLLQAKKAPQEGQLEYGMIELSKSGKSKRFKRVKREDSVNTTQVVDKAFLKDMSNTPILIYNGSLNYAKEAGLDLIGNNEDRLAYLEYVREVSEELMSWIDKIRSGKQEAQVPPPNPQPFKAEQAPAADPGDDYDH